MPFEEAVSGLSSFAQRHVRSLVTFFPESLALREREGAVSGVVARVITT